MSQLCGSSSAHTSRYSNATDSGSFIHEKARGDDDQPTPDGDGTVSLPGFYGTG
jgi:hypothetical protein